MKKHTRATPAGVPRSRSKFTRAQRRTARRLACFRPFTFEYSWDVRELTSAPDFSYRIVDLIPPA